METTAIMWQWLDRPGHDSCRVSYIDSSYRLEGAVVLVHEQQPCRLVYTINCDKQWNTTNVNVVGWVGATAVDVAIAVDHEHRWTLNDHEVAAVAGCIDIDLNFSPATNLLPLRRLQPGIGAATPIRAAWLRFPSFTLEPLEQVYTRLDKQHCHYSSAGGRFTTTLELDQHDFVRDYPGIWQAVAPSTE